MKLFRCSVDVQDSEGVITMKHVVLTTDSDKAEKLLRDRYVNHRVRKVTVCYPPLDLKEGVIW